MNVLSSVFAREMTKIEDSFFTDRVLAKYRLEHHLMPPAGGMGDPNGLCFFGGKYHVFFQYSPFDEEGGLKFWGHYSSENLVDWVYEGVALYPDGPFDFHGAYSGSAVENEGMLHLFYTGNVKLDGDYDYIHDGRRSTVVHVQSTDGEHFEKKKCVIAPEDYPENYTCHVRDPKVFRDGDSWRMALGGRTKEDRGTVLFYRSENLEDWSYEESWSTEEPFGYMWECPDYFELDGQRILSVAPQGVAKEENRFQNLYQAGYFLIEKISETDENVSQNKVTEEGKNISQNEMPENLVTVLQNGTPENLEMVLQNELPEDLKTALRNEIPGVMKTVPQNFREWDMGFDFYAPQTFEDGSGRRILIGWMGMSAGESADDFKTLEEGWQNCLTVPRELRFRDGRIYQKPVAEMETLRREQTVVHGRGEGRWGAGRTFDMEISVADGPVHISVGEEIFLDYVKGKAVLRLSEKAGAGRKTRNAVLESGKLHAVRILADTSAVEIYLNDGEMVFSSRYYGEDSCPEILIQAAEFEGNLWRLDGMRYLRRQRIPMK